MHYNTLLISILATHAAAQVYKGFNYGATQQNGACQDLGAFTNLFNTAKNLQGTSGFTSARLYTTIQCGTPNSPSSAIQAAINTQTSLLLGMWASAGSDAFNNEVAALTSAIQQYPNLADYVMGISVGSEDLYRSSPQGVANQAGVGADASAITDYISRVRRAISGTSLAGKPVGHVDTWTAWVLPENAVVAQAVDFLGHNSFPYFETTHANGIDQGADNFNSAVSNTESVAGGKPVWVTETGWPHTGATSGQAVASTENAKTYWDNVGCSLFGNRNTWWYTLEDANTAQTNIGFGVTSPGSSTPLYDLSCNGGQSSGGGSSAPASSSPTPSSTAQSSSPSTSMSSSSSTQGQTSSSASTSSSATISSTTSVSASTSTDGIGGGVTTLTSTTVVNDGGSSTSTTTQAPTTSGSSTTQPNAGCRAINNGLATGVLAVVVGALALF